MRLVLRYRPPPSPPHPHQQRRIQLDAIPQILYPQILIRGVHTPFGGTGLISQVYYVMLISHIILAISIAYLVPRTFLFAIRGNFERHKVWAKWTFPIWYYVSVTGVLVYFFLYQWWPARAAH